MASTGPRVRQKGRHLILLLHLITREEEELQTEPITEDGKRATESVMEAMFVAKNAMLNLSRAFPRNPSISLRPRRSVSRVCFTSASKSSEACVNAHLQKLLLLMFNGLSGSNLQFAPFIFIFRVEMRQRKQEKTVLRLKIGRLK